MITQRRVLAALMIMALTSFTGSASGELPPSKHWGSQKAVADPTTAPTDPPTDDARLPPRPDVHENNATLLGIDVNHDGVRDDIEHIIYQLHKDNPGHRHVLAIGTRALTEAMKSSVDSSLNKVAIGDQISIFISCFINTTTMDYRKDFGMIKAIILNTEQRATAYQHYNQARSGSVQGEVDYDPVICVPTAHE